MRRKGVQGPIELKDFLSKLSSAHRFVESVLTAL